MTQTKDNENENEFINTLVKRYKDSDLNTKDVLKMLEEKFK